MLTKNKVTFNVKPLEGDERMSTDRSRYLLAEDNARLHYSYFFVMRKIRRPCEWPLSHATMPKTATRYVSPPKRVKSINSHFSPIACLISHNYADRGGRKESESRKSKEARKSVLDAV